MVLVGRIRNSVIFYGRKRKKKKHNVDEDEGKRRERERKDHFVTDPLLLIT